MSDLRPLPALLKKNAPIQLKRRSKPNLFVEMFMAVMLALAILAIGAASAFYWLYMAGVA